VFARDFVFMPHINIDARLSIGVLAGTLVLSYFTHVAWWTWAGLSFVFADLVSDQSKNAMYLLLIISLILFIFGIFRMDWVY
jgi:nucleoside permease NupC